MNDVTRTSKEKVRAFRNAVDRFLTSASNPGRAAAVVHDNTPGSPYHDLVMTKIEIDAMLDGPAHEPLADRRMLKYLYDNWGRSGDDDIELWFRLRDYMQGIATPAPPPSVDRFHGVPRDRPIWICSVCNGWNHARDTFCTNTHAGSHPTKGDSGG